MYILRPKTNKTIYIKEATYPPRLSTWTPILEEAQQWEVLSEAKNAAAYITKDAFAVEVATAEGESIGKEIIRPEDIA